MDRVYGRARKQRIAAGPALSAGLTMGAGLLNHTGREALYSGRIAIQGVPHVQFRCFGRLSPRGTVRSSDRSAGFLDGLEPRRGIRASRSGLAGGISAPHLWLRGLFTLRAPGGGGRGGGGIARRRTGRAGSPVGSAAGMGRCARAVAGVTPALPAGRGYQLFRAPGAPRRRPAGRGLGLGGDL
ncbi:hypothetical protein D3C85_1124020 [compost metagenome]